MAPTTSKDSNVFLNGCSIFVSQFTLASNTLVADMLMLYMTKSHITGLWRIDFLSQVNTLVQNVHNLQVFQLLL